MNYKKKIVQKIHHFFSDKKRVAEFTSLMTILSVGAYLRLHKIADYMTFLGDEGRDVLRIKRMLIDGDIIFLGPTASVGGFFLGPLYYYFMTPFLWLWNFDPVGPAVMVALFGILTIWLTFFVGKKMFHPIVGILASGMYAVSPVVIAYSRSSWNPNLVPFFSLFLIFLLWLYEQKKKNKILFLIGVTWGMGLQFHYLYSFLILLSIAWIWLVNRFKSVVSSLFVLLAGFTVSFSPLIAFEINHKFPNAKAIIQFLLHGSETGFTPASFVTTIGDVIFRSYGRLLFRLPNYELWNSFPDWQITLLVIFIIATILTSCGTLFLFLFGQIFAKKFKKNGDTSVLRYFNVGKQQTKAITLVLFWFLACTVLFGFYRRGIYDYYFGIYFSFPFLATAILLWKLMVNKIGKALSMGIFSGIVFYNLLGSPFVYPPNKQLEQTKTIARAALELTKNKPYNFALLTATNSDHAYRYFFEIWNAPPVTIEQLALDPDRKTVTDQLIIICENPTCDVLGYPLWEVAGFGRAEIAEEKYVFPVRIFRLVRYTTDNENN